MNNFIMSEQTSIAIANEIAKTPIVFSTLAREDLLAMLEDIMAVTIDEFEAARILVLAIKKAAKNRWRTTKSIDKEVQLWLSQGFKNYQEVWDFEKAQSSKAKSNSLPARETVQDWDNQELIEITPEQKEHLEDLMLWFDDRDKYHGAEDETYKQIATFDDWQEWRKKRAISCN